MDKQKSKRQLQAEETKLKLFNTAIEILNKKDFDDIRIKDIVNTAEVSVGSFYKYYESKIDVFYHAYTIADMYFESKVSKELNKNCLVENLEIYFREYALFSSEISGLKLTKLIYNSSNTLINRDMTSGMLGQLTKIISAGMKNNEINNTYSVEFVVNYLMVSARGLVYNWCILEGNYSLEDKMQQYMQVIIIGILS